MIPVVLFYLTRALLRGGILSVTLACFVAASSALSQSLGVSPAGLPSESVSTGIVAFLSYLAVAVVVRWVQGRPKDVLSLVLQTLKGCGIVLGASIALTAVMSLLGAPSPVVAGPLVASLGVEAWRFVQRIRLPKGPRPGQVWYAEVPYEDAGQSKDRPFLVLSVGETISGLMLTSQDKSSRDEYVPLRPPAHERKDGKSVSYLRLDRLIDLSEVSLRRFAWVVDQDVWDLVLQYHPDVFAADR